MLSRSIDDGVYAIFCYFCLCRVRNKVVLRDIKKCRGDMFTYVREKNGAFSLAKDSSLYWRGRGVVFMGYENIIKSCIASKKQVTIEREDVDDEPITAIPIMISQELLLIHYLYDFYIDGYKVLCLLDITKIARGEIEEFHDEIIHKEGILNLLCAPKVSICSWKDFFDSMLKENRLIDISLEKVQSGKTFFVGKVRATNENFLELQEMDGLANYKCDMTKLFYKDITLVSFGNRSMSFSLTK